MSTQSWEKLPALDGRPNPCLCCPPIRAALSMDRPIAVGFGNAHVSRDGEIVYHEPSMFDGMKECDACEWGEVAPGVECTQCGGVGHVEDPDAPTPEYWDVEEAEKLAAADPDHDWQIVLFGPLHGEVYQRHGDGQWMLVEKNEGFA